MDLGLRLGSWTLFPKNHGQFSKAVENLMLKHIKTSWMEFVFVKIDMWRSSKNSRGDGAFCLWDFDGSQLCMYSGIGENCFNRCQPWTIALTGVIGISASWLLLHSIVLTAVVSVLVSAWWFLFLYSYPLVSYYYSTCHVHTGSFQESFYSVNIGIGKIVLCVFGDSCLM